VPLLSTNLIAELQYWGSNFITNSSVNKNKLPIPASIGLTFMPQKSFIELLFNENYYSDSTTNIDYRYLYSENTVRYTWPNVVKNRMLIYPSSAKYYQCDSTGTNFFNLQSEDLTLLDALLQYRIDSTSVTIVDSTSVTFVSNVLHATYSFMTSTLAKLIFIYLDLKIYGRTSNYNNQILLASSTSILETLYESYVLDEIFKVVSARGV